LRTIIINWAIVLLGLTATQGALAVALIIVAHKVSPTEYGQYISCLGLTSFLVVFPNCGLDIWLLAKSSSNTSEIAQLWSSSIRLRSGLLLIWAAGMLLLGLFLPADTFPLEILFFTVCGAAFESLTLLSYTTFRSLGLHGRVALMQTVSALVLLVITLASPLEHGVVLFAAARSVLSIVTLIVVTLAAGKLYALYPRPPISPKKILLSTRPFFLSEIATSVYDRADLTTVSLFQGSTGASIYGPAISLLQISFLAFRAIFFWAVPALSKSFAQSRRTFKNQAAIQLIAQGLAGAILFLIFFSHSKLIVNLIYGAAYKQASEVLHLLSLILLVKSLNFALAAILMAGDRQFQRTKVQLFSALFNVASNLAVIVPFGINGVAIVYILSEMVLLSGYSYIALRGNLSPQDTLPALQPGQESS
jgi:O-antigen/teichoic acid export membrane protein